MQQDKFPVIAKEIKIKFPDCYAKEFTINIIIICGKSLKRYEAEIEFDVYFL